MNGTGAKGDSSKSSIMVLKEGNSPPLGGEVNLILSFGSSGDSQVEVLDLPVSTDEMAEETSEPLHRVRSKTQHFTLPVTQPHYFNAQIASSTTLKQMLFASVPGVQGSTVLSAWDLPP